MTKIEISNTMETQNYNHNSKVLETGKDSKIRNEVFAVPHKKVFVLQQNLETENQAILANAGQNMTLQKKTDGSSECLEDKKQLESPIMDSLDFRYDLNYNKSINVEVSLRNIPDEIDNIDYTEAKNFLKSLGGYFLKYLARKIPEGRFFGDKDCLISIKVWNALFSPNSRSQLGKIKTKKVVLFLQQLDEFNERITTRDWMNYFIEFLALFDTDVFQKKGKIQGTQRIMLYKLLSMLLKRTAELFTQIHKCLKEYNINIMAFKIKEIYKSRVIFSFKTDFQLGDGKLIEPLKVGIDNKKFRGGMTKSEKQHSKAAYKKMSSTQSNAEVVPQSDVKIEERHEQSAEKIEIEREECQAAVEKENSKERRQDLASVYQKEKSHFDDGDSGMDPESLQYAKYCREWYNSLQNFLILSSFLMMDSNRQNFMKYMPGQVREDLIDCKREEQ